MSKTAAKPDPSGAGTNGADGAETKAKAASKAKSLYLVGSCPVLHDHEVYQPGEELELTKAEATRLVGKVTAVTAE